ncbi:MYXO-CTERM domain-containing protein [Nannocystis exedens]|uniref:MYXO-CTERM domain-containing protein n=1 Tax=Nannocystis exedens TaxID=54 RepID=A0A1I1UZ00_9BACT|nr:MYXO-CTERM sorting domain-containing protein [Nannocystis exedens]PCC72214.1 hypothetical protein NAEX_05293 [Nannocystis exedens]SFD76052.1 MYXO-CTERM domain-containing protein [Nannocystis exedens]
MSLTKLFIRGSCLGLVALAGVLTPTTAEACDISADECLADLELVTVEAMPIDGALVWRPVYADAPSTSFSALSIEAATTVVVTPMGGGPEVPGTVVAVESLRAIVWRPAAPLPADALFEVTVTIDNGALSCTSDVPKPLEQKFTVGSSAETTAPLAVPELTGEAVVTVNPQIDFDTLVCCDGAFPTETFIDNCGIGIEWAQGTCAWREGVGRLDATLSLDPVAVGMASGQVGYVYESSGGVFAFPPGEAHVAVQTFATMCGQVKAIQLATGEELLGPEVCVGEELADMLGEQAVDPAPALAGCAEQPYTCLVTSDLVPRAWDPAACTPWPEGTAPTTGAETGESSDSESSGEPATTDASETAGDSEGASDSATAGMDILKDGCACAADSRAGGWGVLALLLPWLGRRRRRG